MIEFLSYSTITLYNKSQLDTYLFAGPIIASMLATKTTDINHFAISFKDYIVSISQTTLRGSNMDEQPISETKTSESKTASSAETTTKTPKKRATIKAKNTSASKAKTTTRKRKSVSKPEKAAAKSRAQVAAINISDEQRMEMIAQAAYYKAEKRGFTGGDPSEDWISAELEIDALLSSNTSQQTPV